MHLSQVAEGSAGAPGCLWGHRARHLLQVVPAHQGGRELNVLLILCKFKRSSLALLRCRPSTTCCPLLFLSGPEASPGQDVVTVQVPTPSQPPGTPSSSSSPGTNPASRDPSEGGESPVVQSDEEGVEVDTVLATLHTDDSDS